MRGINLSYKIDTVLHILRQFGLKAWKHEDEEAFFMSNQDDTLMESKHKLFSKVMSPPLYLM